MKEKPCLSFFMAPNTSLIDMFEAACCHLPSKYQMPLLNEGNLYSRFCKIIEIQLYLIQACSSELLCCVRNCCRGLASLLRCRTGAFCRGGLITGAVAMALYAFDQGVQLLLQRNDMFKLLSQTLTG